MLKTKFLLFFKTSFHSFGCCDTKIQAAKLILNSMFIHSNTMHSHDKGDTMSAQFLVMM